MTTEKVLKLFKKLGFNPIWNLEVYTEDDKNYDITPSYIITDDSKGNLVKIDYSYNSNKEIRDFILKYIK